MQISSSMAALEKMKEISSRILPFVQFILILSDWISNTNKRMIHHSPDRQKNHPGKNHRFWSACSVI